MKIKAIFWDNDGVLVDTERLYFSATKQILATVGIDLTKEMFTEFSLKEGKGAWYLAREKGISETDIRDLRDRRNLLYMKLLENENTLIDGTRDALEVLHNKYIMGIVTSSRKDHFEMIHKKSGLLQYFDFCLTREDYAKSKPDPEPYLLAVDKSGCLKEKCLAIEDTERGLRSAKAAGINCFIIPNELSRGGNFSGADRVLNSIKEVIMELV
jgi:HAD superfamily hydrolase (TIGR01509 family)